MTTESFIKKLLKHIIILIIAIAVISGIESGLGVIINNHIHLSQMTNDDVAFMIMEIYNNTIKPLLNAIKITFYLWNIIAIVYIIFKFIKIKYKEKENESI
jgi:hypothetical protein